MIIHGWDLPSFIFPAPQNDNHNNEKIEPVNTVKARVSLVLMMCEFKDEDEEDMVVDLVTDMLMDHRSERDIRMLLSQWLEPFQAIDAARYLCKYDYA